MATLLAESVCLSRLASVATIPEGWVVGIVLIDIGQRFFDWRRPLPGW
jgi:hypothetical protein